MHVDIELTDKCPDCGSKVVMKECKYKEILPWSYDSEPEYKMVELTEGCEVCLYEEIKTE